MPYHWEIDQTVLTLEAPDGTSLAMAKRTGGGIGIARDGVPLPQCHWSDEHLSECVREFVRLAGLRP